MGRSAFFPFDFSRKATQKALKATFQDCVVCGGAQEANMFSVAAFDGIQSFSVRESEPTEASRPFDRDRDGLVPGGGAATVVLDSDGTARRPS